MSQRDNWRRDATKSAGYEKFNYKHQDTTNHENTKKSSKGVHREGRQINTISDNRESSTGSYFSGNWAEQSSSEEELEQQDLNDGMSSSNEKDSGGKQAREEGSSKGEGKAGKGRK